jgi:hypothetical protein
MPIEHISRLVGHSGTATTETIYRKHIRPVIVQGADAMDRTSPRSTEMRSYSASYSGQQKGHLHGMQMASELVGVTGFEPAASSSRTKRATKLRHTPPTAVEV